MVKKSGEKSATTLHSNAAQNLGSSIINIIMPYTLSKFVASKHLFQLYKTTKKLLILQIHFNNLCNVSYILTLLSLNKELLSLSHDTVSGFLTLPTY